MVVVREDSINFLPCAGFDSLRKDKILFLLIHNCECIVSTQSVRIALIFHNGFCRVRFPIMEQVFFMFLPLPCCTIQQVGVSAKKKMQQIPDFYFKKNIIIGPSFAALYLDDLPCTALYLGKVAN